MAKNIYKNPKYYILKYFTYYLRDNQLSTEKYVRNINHHAVLHWCAWPLLQLKKHEVAPLQQCSIIATAQQWGAQQRPLPTPCHYQDGGDSLNKMTNHFFAYKA